MSAKSRQIQIRVEREQKSALERLAREAGQTLSAYILDRTLPPARLQFDRLLGALRDADGRRFALAELNDLLTSLAPMEFENAVAGAEIGGLSAYLRNYVAAMVELAAQQKGVPPPAWTRQIEPLENPVFASDLRGLRLHLLRVAPIAFKRRNIFVDSSIGDRV